MYSYLNKLKESNTQKISKINEIDNITKDIREQLSVISLRSSDTLHSKIRNDNNQSLVNAPKTESKRHLIGGLVSDIHKNFPGKVELTKYPPYSDALKKISSDEIVLYYGISIKEDGVDKYFVIPSAIKIGSDSIFRTLNDFYAFKSHREAD